MKITGGEKQLIQFSLAGTLRIGALGSAPAGAKGWSNSVSAEDSVPGCRRLDGLDATGDRTL